MSLMKLFWIFVAFYAVVKLCFFIGVYFVSKAIERRALAERARKAEVNRRLIELESMVALYERKLKAQSADAARENKVKYLRRSAG